MKESSRLWLAFGVVAALIFYFFVKGALPTAAEVENRSVKIKPVPLGLLQDPAVQGLSQYRLFGEVPVKLPPDLGRDDPFGG